ncbi:hypothetical protein ACIPWF_08565 [Paenarthrobacter sp. NPDC089989]|uniref:hypothetical protein n=1 Tax=unclassified Paenarthrobacter TaxID=2634190 RepID=UPI0037F960AF
MKQVILSFAIMVATATASTAIMAASPVAGPSRPSDRMVNLGFEDVVNSDPQHLRKLAQRLDSVNATAVSLSVGRTDWTAFPWAARPGSSSGEVSATGRDYVAEAIKAVGTSAGGAKRDIVLTIDVLLGRALRENVAVAGRDVSGRTSPSFAGVAALRNGEAGARLVALAAEVARKYRPTAVDLTELMFDDFTFGPDDLQDYKATTGQTDWPRLSSGAIDAADPHIRTWRSEAVADIARKVGAAVEPYGVKAETDVRSPRNSPSGDRAESGHDYDLLLKQVDRLHVWQYVGINDERAPSTEELVRAMNRRAGSRMSLSLGLWANDGIISAETLAAALRDASRAGAQSVSVTPASLMADAHWDVLKEAWAE